MKTSYEFLYNLSILFKIRKTIVEVVNEKKTDGIKRFKGKHVPKPDLIQRAAEAEQLRRAILEKTDVDIAKTL